MNAKTPESGIENKINKTKSEKVICKYNLSLRNDVVSGFGCKKQIFNCNGHIL